MQVTIKLDPDRLKEVMEVMKAIKRTKILIPESQEKMDSLYHVFQHGLDMLKNK